MERLGKAARKPWAAFLRAEKRRLGARQFNVVCDKIRALPPDTPGTWKDAWARAVREVTND